MKVEIWSEIACPWCYIGKRRFEKALDEFEHKKDVEIYWKPFELNPKFPSDKTVPVLEFLTEHKRISKSEAQGLFTHVTSVAAEVGLQFDFSKIQYSNTRIAHALVQLAYTKDWMSGNQIKERLLKTNFIDGQSVGNKEVLYSIGLDVLGPDWSNPIKDAIENKAGVDKVAEEEKQAVKLVITGVPYFIC